MYKLLALSKYNDRFVIPSDVKVSREGRLEMQQNRGFAPTGGMSIMKDAQKIALIASFLLRYPDEQWYNELPEWREDALIRWGILSFIRFIKFFDYVEDANKKEFEDQYVRTFDFSQNTTMYLSTYEFGRYRGTSRRTR